MKLRGKIALVTGAARNVGKGIALRFACEGAHVVMNDVNAGALDALVDAWKKDGLSVSAALADVSDAEAMRRVVEAVVREFGTLDVLVNNAVIHPELGERGPFLKVTSEGWREFMRRNLDALFFTTQHAARVMAKNRSGSVINLSSNGAVQAHRQTIAYDSLKGAVESFTRAVAVDLAPWNVRVNALRPIAVEEPTPPGEKPGVRDRSLGAMVPMGRIAHPADVAAAAVFLAADDAQFITGQVITIDGGMLEQSRPPQLEIQPVILPEDLEL
ncbi:MAG TPA: SDR family NAD(P)-dependent oxidoreductase [Planctomycetota bacterium]|nr:SDR family NAD(P)-dependent oxidoreductase [Planctomycetota bacterium]